MRFPSVASRLALLALSVALAAPLAGARAQQTVALPQRDIPLAGAPTPVFTVGVDEGPVEQQFGRVAAVAFDADENLYVLDAQNYRVSVFDRRGKFLRQFGRRGGGPGEFQLPTGLTVTADGNVVVSDLGANGYLVFSRDGRFLRSISNEGRRARVRGMYPAPGGGIYVLTMPPIPMPGQPGPTSLDQPMLHHSLRDGATPTQLFGIAQPGARPPEVQGGADDVRVRVSAPPTFSPNVSVGALPSGGFAVFNAEGYDITLTDARGRPTRRLQRPFTPRRVTDRDKEAARDRLRENLRTGRGMTTIVVGGGGGGAPPRPSAEEIERQVRDMQFAEMLPIIQRILVDPIGRI